jgi:hypothetical protein
MSDSAQIIMRLDPLSDAERGRLADGVSQWLLSSQVTTIFDASSAERADLGRTDWSPGPSWRSVVDEVRDAAFESLWFNGVDVRPAVQMQSAYSNYEEWACPRCATELVSTDLIENWVESEIEPNARCSSCGYSALLGDWPAQFPAALVGAPVVTFQNWHPLRATFITDVVEHLGGGRCRYFWQRM